MKSVQNLPIKKVSSSIATLLDLIYLCTPNRNLYSLFEIDVLLHLSYSHLKYYYFNSYKIILMERTYMIKYTMWILAHLYMYILSYKYILKCFLYQLINANFVKIFSCMKNISFISVSLCFFLLSFSTFL